MDYFFEFYARFWHNRILFCIKNFTDVINVRIQYIYIVGIKQCLSLIKRALRVRAHTPNTQKICSETFHSLVQMQLTKRRKNSIFTFVIRLGGVAQLVERLNGIQEVRGSTPLISTTDEKNEPDFIGFFFFSGALRGDAVPPAA